MPLRLHLHVKLRVFVFKLCLVRLLRLLISDVAKGDQQTLLARTVQASTILLGCVFGISLVSLCVLLWRRLFVGFASGFSRIMLTHKHHLCKLGRDCLPHPLPSCPEILPAPASQPPNSKMGRVRTLCQQPFGNSSLGSVRLRPRLELHAPTVHRSKACYLLAG